MRCCTCWLDRKKRAIKFDIHVHDKNCEKFVAANAAMCSAPTALNFWHRAKNHPHRTSSSSHVSLQFQACFAAWVAWAVADMSVFASQ
jgi:hypothetical protein